MNKFISETEVEEKRQKRQEEWDKVRKADDPVEAPEEAYDPRSLYERLQEQKDKKQQDFEESIKFKNHFRGVDQEEVNFLDTISKRAAQLEKQKNDDVKKEIEEFKKAIAQRNLPDSNMNTGTEKEGRKVSEAQKKNDSKKSNAQSNILRKAVKRKSDSIATSISNSDKESKQVKADTNDNTRPIIVYPSAQRCVGLLPGISSYGGNTSSSSESSSDSDDVVNDTS